MRLLSGAVVDHLREVVAAPDLSGTRYRLIRLIGRGGMGAVYLAEDTALAREVALKIIDGAASAPALSERLLREARVIARLEHPGIVPVHDVGTLADGRVYYAMKYVRGQRLDQWLGTSPPRAAALRMFQRVCDAVAFAHAHGVIHRDLKPQNVMVGEFGEALVMDWGIARESGKGSSGESDPTGSDLEGATSSTAAGAVLGTPSFMAPEQARGELDRLDARTDVFALGAVLYFILEGRPPFGGTAAQALSQAIAGSVAPMQGQPRPLEAVCLKALSKEPAERYGAADQLSAEVERFLEGHQVAAHPEGPLGRAVRQLVRYRVIVILVFAYLLMRLGVLLFAGR